MHSAILMIALGGTVASAKSTNTIKWEDDYRAAVSAVSKSQKPMAVFIGSGQAGWTKAVREGILPDQAKKLLTEKYVCLYLDTDTPMGRHMAGSFEIAGRGLVISDTKGSAQAFSHSGDLTSAELTTTLNKFAENSRAIRTTENLGRAGDGYVARVESVGQSSVRYSGSYAPQGYSSQYLTTPSYSIGGG